MSRWVQRKEVAFVGTVRPLPRRLNGAYRHGAEKRRWTERKIGEGWGGKERRGSALWKFGRFATWAFFRVAFSVYGREG